MQLHSPTSANASDATPRSELDRSFLGYDENLRERCGSIATRRRFNESVRTAAGTNAERAFERDALVCYLSKQKLLSPTVTH